MTADDIYLKYLSRKNNIKIVWVPNKNMLGLSQIKDNKTQKHALYKKNIKGKKLNDKCLSIFPII